MESGRTNFNLPAELVDIRLFVEVVTILTDVVQLQVKHIFVGSCQLDPNLEFVKSFTPVRSQNAQIATFFVQKLVMEDVLNKLSVFVQLSTQIHDVPCFFFTRCSQVIFRMFSRCSEDVLMIYYGYQGLVW